MRLVKALLENNGNDTYRVELEIQHSTDQSESLVRRLREQATAKTGSLNRFGVECYQQHTYKGMLLTATIFFPQVRNAGTFMTWLAVECCPEPENLPHED